MSRTIDVLYEDDQLIVFDKPAGLLVIPSPNKEPHTLTSIVNTQCAQEGETRLHPCHRLDRETSGAIIYAKGKKNQQLMMQEFQRHRVKKQYIAFVRGKIKPPEGEIRGAVKDKHKQKYAARARAPEAVTRYRVKEVRRGYSVVEVYPLTGRTNQIRIHFKDIGHPLLGERVYAFGKDFEVKFRRVALHARQLIWYHPVLKKSITVESPLAKDMSEFLGHGLR